MSALCECLFGLVRVLWSLVIGIPLGLVPGLITAIGVIGITLVRYPLNFYKTFRVVIMTALLKKRLKFLMLLSLAVIQILYPIIGLIVALVVAVVICCGACVACAYTMDNFGSLLKSWPSLFKTYWNDHERFYNETLEKYNHPSGVPMNWDGRRYDVPELGFKKTVCGVILTIYGVTIMTLGATLLLAIKYIPAHLNAIFQYLKTIMFMFTCVSFPFLPFWLIGLALVIALGPVVLVLGILIAPLSGLKCPYIAIKHNNIGCGFKEAFVLLSELDRMSFGMKIQIPPPFLPKVERVGEEWTLPSEQAEPPSNKYWPLYVTNCQEVCKDALAKGWVNKEDLEGCMPNVIQAIPAMAIVAVLLRSVDEEPDKESIFWTKEERCDAKTCRTDDLAQFFWPKLMNVRKQLKTTTKEEQEYLMAKLCANSEEVPTELKDAVDSAKIDENKQIKLHRLCGDVNNIVIVLLRMEKMQSNLPNILGLQDEDNV